MNVQWVKDVQRQCKAAKIPFFFKQWGGVQKAKNGRSLDGKTYDAMPELSTNAPPERSVRERHISHLASAAIHFDNGPLVHITRRTHVA